MSPDLRIIDGVTTAHDLVFPKWLSMEIFIIFLALAYALSLERFAGLCKGAEVGPRSARVRDVHRAPQARDWPLTLIRKPL